MRLLVVCRHNAGRSQIAGAIFRGCCPGWDVVTAGAEATEGAAMAWDVVAATQEIGYDIALTTRRHQITPELFDSADAVIMITAKDTWPDYVVGGKVPPYSWGEMDKWQNSATRNVLNPLYRTAALAWGCDR